MRDSFAVFGGLIALEILFGLVGAYLADIKQNPVIFERVLDSATNWVMLSVLVLLAMLLIDLVSWANHQRMLRLKKRGNR